MLRARDRPGVSGGSKIVATATDNAGNTSEFSAPVTVSVPSPDDVDLPAEALAARASPNPPLDLQICAVDTVALLDSDEPQEQYAFCDTGNVFNLR